jgi:uncharacterized RDD family membrane protein YckC
VTAVPTAGFFSRFVAIAIDAVVVGVALSLSAFTVNMIWSLVSISDEVRFDEDWLPVIAAGIATLFAMTYHVACWRYTGSTLGKAVMGLKVVNHRGDYVSVPRGIVRFLGYSVSAVLLGAGFFWAIVDRRHRAWHDLLAGTRVVYLPSRSQGRVIAAVSRFEATSVARR